MPLSTHSSFPWVSLSILSRINRTVGSNISMVESLCPSQSSSFLSTLKWLYQERNMNRVLIKLDFIFGLCVYEFMGLSMYICIYVYVRACQFMDMCKWECILKTLCTHLESRGHFLPFFETWLSSGLEFTKQSCFAGHGSHKYAKLYFLYPEITSHTTILRPLQCKFLG